MLSQVRRENKNASNLHPTDQVPSVGTPAWGTQDLWSVELARSADGFELGLDLLECGFKGRAAAGV